MLNTLKPINQKADKLVDMFNISYDTSNLELLISLELFLFAKDEMSV